MIIIIIVTDTNAKEVLMRINDFFAVCQCTKADRFIQYVLLEMFSVTSDGATDKFRVQLGGNIIIRRRFNPYPPNPALNPIIDGFFWCENRVADD